MTVQVISYVPFFFFFFGYVLKIFLRKKRKLNRMCALLRSANIEKFLIGQLQIVSQLGERMTEKEKGLSQP